MWKMGKSLKLYCKVYTIHQWKFLQKPDGRNEQILVWGISKKQYFVRENTVTDALLFQVQIMTRYHVTNSYGLEDLLVDEFLFIISLY